MDGIFKTTWDTAKTYVNTSYSNIQYTILSDVYYITVNDRIGGMIFECYINITDPDPAPPNYDAQKNATWKTDFETNYKPNVYSRETLDGLCIVRPSPRPMKTVTCFTSESDDTANNYNIWGGQSLYIDQDTTNQTIYADFNVLENKSHILSGGMFHTGMAGDKFNLFVVPKVTSITNPGTGYKLYGGYLIVPNDFPLGDPITVADNDRVLVGVTQNHDGSWPVGYWDATYNTTTHLFENITPNLTGTGKYNMFSVEVILFKFIVNYLMVSGTEPIENKFISFDPQEIGANMRIKLSIDVNGTHNFKWYGYFNMYRFKTC